MIRVKPKHDLFSENLNESERAQLGSSLQLFFFNFIGRQRLWLEVAITWCSLSALDPGLLKNGSRSSAGGFFLTQRLAWVLYLKVINAGWCNCVCLYKIKAPHMRGNETGSIMIFTPKHTNWGMLVSLKKTKKKTNPKTRHPNDCIPWL